MQFCLRGSERLSAIGTISDACISYLVLAVAVKWLRGDLLP